MSVSLDEVIATDELNVRPVRKCTPEDLVAAYDSLAKELVSSPDRLLQSLSETAMTLCGAQSAGISILEEEKDGTPEFRWRAVAGEYGIFLGNSMPRHNSPCGAVFDHRRALLMVDPERHYTYLNGIEPRVAEVLLVPFYVDGHFKGTIWAVSHESERRFSADDLQTMTRLSSFAAVGYQARIAMTDLKKSNEDLAEAHAALKTAEYRKDEFLAILSHELRTPLMAILGWSQLLKAGVTGEEHVKKAAETIERNARLQAKLIEDLLDMNRILAGKLRLSVEDVDLTASIDAAIDSIQPQATEKRISIRRELDSRASVIRGDQSRLQQCIWNLLTNAIKFTPADGIIEIRLRCTEGGAEISITDSGIGIAPEFLNSVFDRFSQVDSTITRKSGGLGLGLPIVKSLVEMHHGTVGAMSPGLEAGSTFRITLPLPGPRATSPGKNEPTSLDPGVDISGLRILIVDDAKDSSDVLSQILTNAGAVTTVACAAEEAMQILQKERCDLLISDVGMPGMDGYEFLRQIRDMDKAAGKYLPAIALTGHVRADQRIQTIQAGYDTVLAKPIEIDKLVATVARVARESR